MSQAATTAEPLRLLKTDLHPPLSRHEARVEADRCYFCHDAPCVTACPTGIDIPLFIRQIHAANVAGAGKTIFDENIFGGMCARVCPTETLCEEACVRQAAEQKPVRIGLLQRHATDHVMATGRQPYTRAATSGSRVAVVGAGPAGIACAHRLSRYGHDVTVFDDRSKAGGLNEYGIAAYKTVEDFAQREIDYILSIGGISVQSDQRLGQHFTLADLKKNYDAVFLGIGLSGVNVLGLPDEDAAGVVDAVEFIGELRQASDPAAVVPGRRVVVIGGGMTAIDAAVQSRLLGAEEVTIAYRRGIEHMNASSYEQELAKIRGVVIKPWLRPVKLSIRSGKLDAIEFERTELIGERLGGTGSMVRIEADRVLKAIGQAFDEHPLAGSGLTLSRGRIKTDHAGRTSDSGVWAGGDCRADSADLTVAAVQDGKLAAESIHTTLFTR